MTDSDQTTQAMGLVPTQTPPVAGQDGHLHPMFESVIGEFESMETRYERLRHAYASLMEHHLELMEQLQTVHDIHIVTDSEGTILETNQAAKLLLAGNEMLGTPLRNWVTEDSLE
ncbi:MAG: hypothetical protein ACR2I0_09860, partial [Rhodoferax sp.]